MIRWWNIPEEDLKIIIDDWNKIHDKLEKGLAHELSEGDTLYLGACTKSSDSSKRRKQFGKNAPDAKPRAYCLKKQYMYWLVVDSFLDKKNVHINSTMNLSKKYMEKVIKEKKSLGVAVKTIADYQQGETFEDLIIRKFEPFYGKSLMEISTMTGQKISFLSKDFAYQTCMAILGLTGRKIAEFEKAGILLKSISLGHDGKSLKESMSFPAFKYIDVAEEEEWEESGWYETVSSRFFFPVFQKSQDEVRPKMILRKVFFWAMPERDKEQCRIVWEDTRDKIREDDYEHFMRMTQNDVSHVRPHAKDSNDTYPTPAGGWEPKKCFWLNRDYVLKQVNLELSKERKIITWMAASDSHLGESNEGVSIKDRAKSKIRTSSLQRQLEFLEDKPVTLQDQIVSYLKGHPKSSASAIARSLKVSMPLINSLLNGKLQGRVKKDEAKRWSVVQ